MIAIMSVSLVDRLRELEGKRQTLRPGDYLFRLDEPVAALFLVEEGEIRLTRHQEEGGVVILQRAGAGDIPAEASFFSDRYHCDAIAGPASVVRRIPIARLRALFRSDPDFAELWGRRLANQIQDTRLRNEILSLRTVAARLDGWLAWHGELPPKGEWKWLAHQLGVSPEALYREIASRRS